MISYLRDGARDLPPVLRHDPGRGRPGRARPACSPASVVRMIHACGMVDLVDDVAASPGFARAATRGAAGRRPGPVRRRDGGRGGHARAPARRQRRRLHARRARDRRARAVAGHDALGRGARALARPARGLVAVVGNAPTALFRLLELVDEGRGGRRRSSACRSGSSAPPSPRWRWPSSDRARVPRRPRPPRRQRDRRGRVNALASERRIGAWPGGCSASASAPATRSWSR